jgi:uncharacterized protein
MPGGLTRAFLISGVTAGLFQPPALAGAAPWGRMITLVWGGIFCRVIPLSAGLFTSPDWFLGSLFGSGDFIGIYSGILAQKPVAKNGSRGFLVS